MRTNDLTRCCLLAALLAGAAAPNLCGEGVWDTRLGNAQNLSSTGARVRDYGHSLAVYQGHVYGENYWWNGTNLLLWNTNTFLHFGGGYDMAALGTNLFIAGWMAFGPFGQDYMVAGWNGANWFHGGIPGSRGYGPWVLSLAVAGTNLYAGGTFDYAGGRFAPAIARWDGTSWHDVGGGITDPNGGAGMVLSMVEKDGELIVCGGPYAGGVPCSRWPSGMARIGHPLIHVDW